MHLLLGLLLFTESAFAIPASFTDKADLIPNICESCYPKLIRWGGKPYCAPAAVSNSLVWLSKNGFPALQEFNTGNPETDQARLVELLGEIMGTTETGGTTPMQVLTGLKKYFEAKHIPYKRFAAVGWRDVPSFVAWESRSTTLNWIKEGILGRGSVWILVGWYKHDSKTDRFRIFDGHWMTVVGYKKDILILHDPAERAERRNYYATATPMESGKIDSQAANGVLRIGGDVVIKPGADGGVIQGAYRVEL